MAAATSAKNDGGDRGRMLDCLLLSAYMRAHRARFEAPSAGVPVSPNTAVPNRPKPRRSDRGVRPPRNAARTRMRLDGHTIAMALLRRWQGLDPEPPVPALPSDAFAMLEHIGRYCSPPPAHVEPIAAPGISPAAPTTSTSRTRPTLLLQLSPQACRRAGSPRRAREQLLDAASTMRTAGRRGERDAAPLPSSADPRAFAGPRAARRRGGRRANAQHPRASRRRVRRAALRRRRRRRRRQGARVPTRGCARGLSAPRSRGHRLERRRACAGRAGDRPRRARRSRAAAPSYISSPRPAMDGPGSPTRGAPPSQRGGTGARQAEAAASVADGSRAPTAGSYRRPPPGRCTSGDVGARRPRPGGPPRSSGAARHHARCSISSGHVAHLLGEHWSPPRSARATMLAMSSCAA